MPSQMPLTPVQKAAKAARAVKAARVKAAVRLVRKKRESIKAPQRLSDLKGGHLFAPNMVH